MKKIFFTSWFILFVICLWIVVGAHFKPFGRKFFYPRVKNGNQIMTGLHNQIKVDFYKEYCPYITNRYKTSLDEADIIAHGDSFFNSYLGDLYFGDQLQNATGKKVYTADTREADPLKLLKENNYPKKETVRLLLLESGEEFSFDKASKVKAEEYHFIPRNFWEKLTNAMQWRTEAANTWLRENLITLNKRNQNIKIFFEDNILFYPLAKCIANFQFEYLDELSSVIGAYSREPKMIFHKDSVGFDRREKTEKEIDELVAYVSRVSEELKEKYNIQLIYILIPTKYTIYHDLVDDHYTYDDFIPRIYQLLEKRGVKVIDIYTAYKKYRETDDSQMLYYAADSHWTPFGKKMFVQEVVKTIDALNNNL